jgi:hypothetical protein
VNLQRILAIFLLLGFVFIVILGMLSDLRAIPPDFGTRCRNADVEIREQTPSSELPKPPPGVDQQLEEGSAFPETASSIIFELDQLSSQVGLNLNGTRDAEVWAERTGAGWYIDWNVQRRYPTQLPEHWQMVRLGRGCIYPSEEAIVWLASNYPGNVWIIGNEPDNIWQDNVFPEEFAQVYNRLYYLIKAADPSALVAVGGVTQVTSLRLTYLDRVLNVYSALYQEHMPVDWWTVHGFILPEVRGSGGAEIPAGLIGVNQGELYAIDDIGNQNIFQDQIIAFRSWMAERGYRDTPLAITEFGISVSPENYPPDVVAKYLWDTFSWLGEVRDIEIGYPVDDYHLVQRWAWYSLYSDFYATSNLANLPADKLTEIGQAYREYNLTHSP